MMKQRFAPDCSAGSEKSLAAVSLVLMCVMSAAAAEIDAEHPAYRRAQELMDRGILFEAAIEWERYLEDQPDDHMARMKLAHLLFQLRRDHDAVSHAARVMDRRPDFAEARQLLVRIRSRLGQELDPDDPEAVLYFARLCSRLRAYDRASIQYRRYLALTNAPAVRLEWARMLEWADRPAEAIEHYQRYLETHPADSAARYALGRAFLHRGMHTQALESFFECRRRGFRHADLDMSLAQALAWSGHEEESVPILEHLVRQSPDHLEARRLLADLLLRQGRVTEAYPLYRDILRAQDDREVAQLVFDLEHEGTLEIARLRARVEEYPSDGSPRRELALALERRGRYEEALAEYDILHGMAPQDEFITRQRDDLRIRYRERLARRVDDLRDRQERLRRPLVHRGRAWINRHPADTRTRFLLVDMYTRGGRYDEAEQELRALRQIGIQGEEIERRQKRLDDARRLEAHRAPGGTP